MAGPRMMGRLMRPRQQLADDGSRMRRISSRYVFVFVRVFPVVWFGGLAVMSAVGVRGMAAGEKIQLQVLLAPVAMAACGYFLMRKQYFDLADEVWDAGDYLVVRDAGQEERVALCDIVDVQYSFVFSPQRVTLTLHRPNCVRKKIAFAPPQAWFPFWKDRIVEDLVRRVSAASSPL